jgi:hypothetical protein
MLTELDVQAILHVHSLAARRAILEQEERTILQSKNPKTEVKNKNERIWRSPNTMERPSV